MATEGQGLTLGQILDRAIDRHEQVVSAPSTSDPHIQSLILEALSDLALCSSLVKRLGVFSTNEIIDEVNTQELRCFVVEALRGELEAQRRTSGGVERKARLEVARDHYEAFVGLMDSYDVVPRAQRKLFAGPAHSNQNPALRREAKIAQFKVEKELKAQLAEARRRRTLRHNTVRTVAPNGTEAGPSTSRAPAMPASDDEEDSDRRPFYLAWLKSLYLQAHQELASIAAEVEMLSHGMQMSDLPTSQPARDGDERQRARDDGDPAWRLDAFATGKGLRDASGPLVSPSGKVLRPFTILPSSSREATRLRLQSEVFRPDWTLPTMTIDEYLDEQQAMGNLLSGGGPGQEGRETDGERKRREAEDDTTQGEEKEEELRREKIKWDEFADTHRKGEGNMMNRG